jgi:hypothetical protein
MLFLVLGEVTLEGEALKPAILYQALYDDYRLWVRIKTDFLQTVSIPEHDYHGPRFQFMKVWEAADQLLHPEACPLFVKID